MAGKKLIGGIVLGLAVLSLVVLLVRAGNYRQGPANGGLGAASGKGLVGIIEIEGVISGDYSTSALFEGSVTGARTVAEQLREVSKDPDIKAVVLRINSPGGTPAASQEIAEEVNRLRESGVKVVTSMGDVAASGAYWIASSSDMIVADPGTITGSIGVIMSTQNYRGLYDKLGIEPQTVKSGEYKDMGSSDRPMTAEERKLFQAMVDDTYEQFVETVSKGRKISPQAVRDLQGRALTGRQALNAGLVDQLGNYYDAVSLAGEISGLGKIPDTRVIGETSKWWRFLGGIEGATGSFSPVMLRLENCPDYSGRVGELESWKVGKN
ncbi:MAG: signal peptide peptidase SppA [Bacillota bacterium]